MGEFEFDPVGVGEEEGVVALAVWWIFGWSVEDGDSRVDEEAMESIDVGAAERFEGDVVKPAR
ncbi:MAG TPA: hypothetical protein VGI47_08745 [Candidatus Binataceae bacterium]